MRLVVYDRTCRGRGPLPGLSHAWSAGSALYRGSSWAEAAHGATSWVDALDWLARVRPGEVIDEIQFWGHGKWGYALVGGDVLDRTGLRSRARQLEAVRERLAPGGALFWFRTCETLGAHRGQEFARAFADVMRCTVAGHTYVIGFWQSGLHALAPGCAPSWSPTEGLLDGTADDPIRAAWSAPGQPRTITCLVPRLPAFAASSG